MRQIGYTQRICSDEARINEFLTRSRTGVLGLQDGDWPYAVPVNYVWLDGCVYLHGMGSGRKTELLEQSPRVCFTVYEEIGTVTDPMPCHADTSYLSVMLFGRAEPVTDHAMAAGALQALVNKFMPGFYKQTIGPRLVEKYRSDKDGKGVAVFRIVPEVLTAKENAAPPESLFSQ